MVKWSLDQAKERVRSGVNKLREKVQGSPEERKEKVLQKEIEDSAFKYHKVREERREARSRGLSRAKSEAKAKYSPKPKGGGFMGRFNPNDGGISGGGASRDVSSFIGSVGGSKSRGGSDVIGSLGGLGDLDGPGAGSIDSFLNGSKKSKRR